VTAPAERVIEGRFGVDAILATLQRIDGPDPTFRKVDGVWWRAARRAEGPVTVAIAATPERVRLRAWGPGAESELAEAPDRLGVHDDPSAFTCDHPALRDVVRGRPELRFGRTGEVVDALIPAILGQRVTGKAAFLSYRDLVRRFGDPAPGPEPPVRLPPDPERLANEPYYALHPIGIERTRATTLIEVCRRRKRLDALAREPAAVASERLHGLRGVGPWTAACVLVASHGDPDAVPVGDYHLPSQVAWVLAGEPRADDARMLELLAPWAGHRARALRLILATGLRAPRFGPRVDTPDLRSI
jgi:3-methyladenine DNA glycosylase/8-oxoguanine DNA glycosylase